MCQDRRWELFECQRCGKCCIKIGLPYDGNSIFEIARFFGLSADQIIDNYYGRVSDDRKSWMSEDDKRTPCPFFEVGVERNACAIYPVRPQGCRFYPFGTDFGRQGVDCPAAKIVYDRLEKEAHSQDS